jgi:WD40 repeat protein
LYDPATGAFTATGSLNTARAYHTATPLSNGLALITGGTSSSNSALASAELYNPATGTFTATDNLNTARSFHTATLLPTGKVLVSGGVAQATSELYQFGANHQLQPQSCSYEGHIKSVAAFSTPTAVRFVNNSASVTFQVFWLDYNGNRVLYATLGPGQSFVQQTFLTHPWVIADTSPAAACQQIYLPLPEQASAIFP